jgi:hypothetical protein
VLSIALMNKPKLAILVLVPVGVLVFVLAVWKKDRAAILAQSEMIGRELVSQTNSPHLPFAGNIFQRRLAEFLATPARVEAVRYGDEPRPGTLEAAASRVYLINQQGSRLALRISPEADHKHWRILGWWSPTSPPPPKSP